VRKLWPLAAVLALGAVTPLPAQVSMTTFSGTRGTNPQASIPVGQTAGINQMLPTININNALMSRPGGPRAFDFSKMLPNFSFINNRWPLNVSQPQVPAKYFGPYNQIRSK
jgi:hypothetical protein